jgi:hypothetical protein
MIKRRMIAAAGGLLMLNGCAVADWISAPCSDPCTPYQAPQQVYNPYTGTSSYVYGAPPQQQVYVPMSQPASSATAPAQPFVPQEAYSDGTPYSTAPQGTGNGPAIIVDQNWPYSQPQQPAAPTWTPPSSTPSAPPAEGPIRQPCYPTSCVNPQ